MCNDRVFVYLCVLCCSNGVGRTGVFVTLHIILERMLVEGLVDAFQTVKNLRIQRPAMVQTLVRPTTLSSVCVCICILCSVCVYVYIIMHALTYSAVCVCVCVYHAYFI